MIYNMTIPFAGSVLASISAESEKEARKKALDLDFRIELISKSDNELDINTFSLLEKIVTGNICNVEINEISINETIYEDEDDDFN